MTQIPRVDPKNQKKSTEHPLTFLEHLRELRRRIVFVVLALLGGSVLGYTFHDAIVHTLLGPLGGQKLVYLTPGGGFDFIFKVSLYVGLAVAIPVAIYQVYTFLRPLMPVKTRRFTIMVVGVSAVLAAGGMLFGFLVALPGALKFLTSFGGEYIQANLTASSYLDFVAAYLLGLAALFQLPLLLLFINLINGPFKPSKLLATEPYVFLGVFVLAAIITPTPDIVNQSIVAGPVLAVYQLGIGMTVLYNRKQVLVAMRTPPPFVRPVVAPQPQAAQQSTHILQQFAEIQEKALPGGTTASIPSQLVSNRHMDFVAPARSQAVHSSLQTADPTRATPVLTQLRAKSVKTASIDGVFTLRPVSVDLPHFKA